MEQNEKIQKVIGQLRKLQRFYESVKEVGTEGEVNAAAAAIQRLLTEYNLTMEEIGEEPEKNLIIDEKISGYENRTHGGDWVQKLTHTICKYNFCRCYYFGRGNKTLLIVGEKQNIETVKWLRSMLMDRFIELGKKRYKAYTIDYDVNVGCYNGTEPQRRNPWLRRYLLGCAAGLDAKLSEERKAMEKEKNEVSNVNNSVGSNVTALVLKKDAAIVEYIKKAYAMGKPRQQKQLSWTSASMIGYKDGKNTDLYKPIESSKSGNVKMIG